MKRFIKIFIRIFGAILVLVIIIYTFAFLFLPSQVLEFYRGSNETTIWVKVKYLPIEKEISGTDSYKHFDLNWSPNKRHLVFSDFIDEETYNKEWAIKIINPRTFQVKTIFIGTNFTSRCKWISNDTVRVYVTAGSGVRIYRDININIKEPFIAADHLTPEYWVPEKISDYEI